MNSILITTIILVSLSLIHCQSDEPCSVSKGNSIQIGNKVYLCLKVKTLNNVYVYAYRIVVDKMTVLQISDITAAINSTGNISLVLQYQNITSQQQIVSLHNIKVLQDSLNGVYQQIVSIIVESKNGIFSQFYYETQDCSSCLGTNQQVCVQGQCYYTGSLSDINNLLVYISWIGTDISGQHFVSQTMRLKKLNIFSQQNIYLSALSLVQ